MTIEDAAIQEVEELVEPKKEFELADDSFQDLMSSINQGDESASGDFEGLMSNDYEFSGNDGLNTLTEISDNKSGLEVSSHEAPDLSSAKAPPKEEVTEKPHDTVDSKPANLPTSPNESVVEHDIENFYTDPDLNERMAYLLRESNEAGSTLLSSIAHTRGILNGFVRERRQLGEVIDKKRQESAKLKEMISELEPSQEITDEECSERVVTANCASIIKHTKNIQTELSGNSSKNWLGDMERIEVEAKMLKMRMQYIELLEEIDRDFVTYQRVRKEEQESKLRFQNYRSFFE